MLLPAAGRSSTDAPGPVLPMAPVPEMVRAPGDINCIEGVVPVIVPLLTMFAALALSVPAEDKTAPAPRFSVPDPAVCRVVVPLEVTLPVIPIVPFNSVLFNVRAPVSSVPLAVILPVEFSTNSTPELELPRLTAPVWST